MEKLNVKGVTLAGRPVDVVRRQLIKQKRPPQDVRLLIKIGALL